MAESAEWSGFKPTEQRELRAAVEASCECEFTDSILIKRCSACSMLLEDGRMAHLLFARRLRGALQKSEHVVRA